MSAVQSPRRVIAAYISSTLLFTLATSLIWATNKLKLPRGTFRVRARFKDAAHTTAKYNTYKTIYVK